MNSIKSLTICQPTKLNNTMAGIVISLSIAAVAIFIISISSANTPFNAIRQLGTTANGLLLGSSIFLFILGLAWFSLTRKKEEVSQNIDPALVKVRALRDIVDSLPFPGTLKVLTMSYLVDEYSFEDDPFFVENNAFWQDINLRNFSCLTILDRTAWTDIPIEGLTFGDVEIDKRECIRRIHRLSSKVVGKRGLTLLTIPQGLSLGKFTAFAMHIKIKNQPIYRVILPLEFNAKLYLKKEHETSVVLIPNDVIEGTFNSVDNNKKLTFEQQEQVVSNLGISWELPKTLEMTILMVLTFMQNNRHLYPLFWSRCKERFELHQVVAGNFKNGKGGFSIEAILHDEIQYYTGIAPCLRFAKSVK